MSNSPSSTSPAGRPGRVRRAAVGGALAATALAAGALALPATAAARAHAASVPAVRAALTYQGNAQSGFGHETLTIWRGGRVAYRRAVTATGCGSRCEPGSILSRADGVQVARLNSTGEPQVVLTLFAPGGRAGAIEQVFEYSAQRHSYVKYEHVFADPGAQLRPLGHGRYGFVGADGNFARRFTDAAASGLPVQVELFENGMFYSDAGAYPKLLSADAAHWLRLYKGTAASHWSDSVGFIAAWAADENELGNMHGADRYLAQEAQAGHLNSASSGARLSGRRFISDLNRYLLNAGYVPMCGGF